MPFISCRKGKRRERIRRYICFHSRSLFVLGICMLNTVIKSVCQLFVGRETLGSFGGWCYHNINMYIQMALEKKIIIKAFSFGQKKKKSLEEKRVIKLTYWVHIFHYYSLGLGTKVAQRKTWFKKFWDWFRPNSDFNNDIINSNSHSRSISKLPRYALIFGGSMLIWYPFGKSIVLALNMSWLWMCLILWVYPLRCWCLIKIDCRVERWIHGVISCSSLSHVPKEDKGHCYRFFSIGLFGL